MTLANDQKPENSRRRIVVPLGQARENPRSRKATSRVIVAGSTPARKGRVVKVLAILALVLVVIVLALAGGAFLWWRHYQTTPPYSLAVLVDAAQHNDMTGVDKIVDTDRIVDDFAGQVIEKAGSRYGGALNGEVSKTIRARVPTLLPRIKQQVRDAVAARVKEISVKADQKPFLVIAVAMPYVVQVTIAGDKADAVANIHDQQVKMNLERSGDIWRVVAVQDNALVERLVDEVIKDLPAIAPGLDFDLRKRARKPAAPISIP